MNEENPYYNQSIDCTVHNCSYCDCGDNKCTLSKIKVCNYQEDNEKRATTCDSFKKRCN